MGDVRDSVGLTVEEAYEVIEAAPGFDDDTSGVGEAWAVVREYISMLEMSDLEAQDILESLDLENQGLRADLADYGL